MASTETPVNYTTWPVGAGRIDVGRWWDGHLRITITLGRAARRHGMETADITPDDLRTLADALTAAADRDEQPPTTSAGE